MFVLLVRIFSMARGITVPRLLETLNRAHSAYQAANSLSDAVSSAASMFRRPSTSGAPPRVRPRLSVLEPAASRVVARSFRPARFGYGRRRPTGCTRRFRRRRSRPCRPIRRNPCRRPLYNRRFKGFRRFNRGPFRIGSFLSSGGSLPRQTFLRMTYRASALVDFSAVPAERKKRILEPNSVALHSNLVDNSSANETQWQYLDVFKTFYEKYLILGSTTKVIISQVANPTAVGTTVQDNANYPTAGPRNNAYATGYWYVRLNYMKDGEEVGADINDAGTVVETSIWPTLRDFLVDPTVMYIKDVAVRSQKTGFLWPKPTATLGSTHSAVPNENTSVAALPQFYYEAVVNNRAVTFNIKFSGKKHFGDKNFLRNGPWRDWSEGSLSAAGRFQAYVGYIAFDYTNKPVSEGVSNGFYRRRMSIETSAYVACQGPRITPSSRIDSAVRGLQANIEYQNALDVLEYAVNRSPHQDLSNPELETELDQEIENLLEHDSDGAESEESSQSDIEILGE